MRFVDIIEKKREGCPLSTEEIRYWIQAYTAGDIPDYQVSALLMAIVLNGMDRRETTDLTMAMMYSGDVVDLGGIDGVKVDKHSTGGVGDKTTLALGPMVAACGVKMAKMSGRGLGHTGGTLDKLEAIPGFNCFLDREAFIRQVNDIGLAVIGQSDRLVPADKKLYALRDVTATVASIPLIASSIMSKKLASGTDVIDLDVKYGDGAFMRTPEDAVALAETMIHIGNALGRRTRAMITDMDEPLGRAIGNALEVKEAVDTLRGRGPEDFTELCLSAGSVLLTEAQAAKDLPDARKRLEKTLADGSALEKLRAMVQAQGGDVSVIDDPDRLPKARYVTPVYSKTSGYVKAEKAMSLGTLAMWIGAGRSVKEDAIWPETGIVLNKKVGDFVRAGETLAWAHHRKALSPEWIEAFEKAFVVTPDAVTRPPLIYKML